MNARECPSHQDLLAYAAGKLSEPASDALDIHFECCPDCNAALSTLEEVEDTLVTRLRRAQVPGDYEQEAEYGEAVAKAKALAAAQSSREASAGLETSVFERGPLGEYELLEKLGEGGMGRVFKAHHAKLKREVALKLLPKNRLRDEGAIGRFEREMEAVGRLNHANIVQAYDAREIEGTYFLVMEYVYGVDLSEVVRQGGPLKIADACEVIRQAAMGLQHAHEHGLVHRDIKPSNLMVSTEGTVKILDLGLARFPTGPAPEEAMPSGLPELPHGRETATGDILGTPDYVAPEQVRGARTVDIRTDIYSLGCTLYTLLAGRAPFSGPEYVTRADKIVAHVEKPVAPIRRFRNDVPGELANVLDRMLAKDPSDRFATPAEVADAMGRFTTRCDLPRLLASAKREAASAASVGEPVPSARSPSAREGISSRSRIRPKKVAVAATCLALALLIIFGAIIHVRSRDGTLVVEVNEPDAVVQILDEQGKVQITRRADRGNVTIAVDPGKHRLRVEKDGFKFFARDFAIESSGTTTIKAWLEPLEIPTAASPVVVDADRQAAEWVLGIGGSVRLSADGRLQDVRGIRGLPQESLQVREVHLGGNSLVNDAELKHLEGLSSLNVLYLDHTQVGDAGLEHLRELSGLEKLFLWNTRVTDDGLRNLQGLSSLKLLGLQGLPISDAGLEHLRSLTELQELYLSWTPINGGGFRHLKRLTKLKLLHVQGTPVTDAGLQHLEALKELQNLWLWDTHVTDAGLKHLEALKHLQELSLTGTRISDAGLECLAGLTELQRLYLTSAQIGDAGVEHLKRLTNLRLLHMPGTRVTDAGLEHLKRLVNLSELKLTDTQVTPTGVAALKTELPKCTIIVD